MEGEIRFSHKATVAALLINLYRDEPILHMPFQLLTCLVDMDELLTTWRYRHAQMVLRMLGRKIGTGGSSGYDYLQSTAARHHIFKDLHNISTLLIPRSELPGLPEEVRKQLGFYFSGEEIVDCNKDINLPLFLLCGYPRGASSGSDSDLRCLHP